MKYKKELLSMQEQVCEALGDYYKADVSYTSVGYRRTGFYLTKSGQFIVRFEDGNVVFANGMYIKATTLPVNIVEIIAKFYKEVIKNEEKTNN